MNNDGTDNQKLLDFSTKVYFYKNSYDFIYVSNRNIYKSNIDGTINLSILDLTTINGTISIEDFDPVNNGLLMTIAEKQGFPRILAKYDFNKQQLDTLLLAEGNWIYYHPKFSNDYKKIALIEVDDVTMNYKISLVSGNNKTDLIELTDENEWIDFHPLAFSGNDKYLAYSKNVNQPGEFVSWKSYLYIIDLETRINIFIDEGINPCWKLSTN